MDLTAKLTGNKAVFLDLDNTLYPYAPCHRHALRKSHAAYRRIIGPIAWRVFLKRYESARGIIHRRLKGQAASHSRLLYFQAMLESAGETKICRRALQLENIYWGSFLRWVKFYPWVRPFLAECKRRGKRVLIVTNLTSGIQMRKVRRFRLEAWIHALVTSEEAGAEKPHPKIFRLALKKAHCKPREIFSVGDDPGDAAPFGEFFRVRSKT